MRIGVVLGAAVLFLLVAPSEATPIKPDVRKLVEQPQAPPPPYEPARAGWNGPETSPGQQAMAAAQQAHARAVHRSLALVVTPDPRAWLVILAMIVLLRKARSMREARGLPAEAQRDPEWQMPRAA